MKKQFLGRALISPQIKQIKDAELIPSTELIFSSFSPKLSIWGPNRYQCNWLFDTIWRQNLKNCVGPEQYATDLHSQKLYKKITLLLMNKKHSSRMADGTQRWHLLFFLNLIALFQSSGKSKWCMFITRLPWQGERGSDVFFSQTDPLMAITLSLAINHKKTNL